MTKCFSFEKAIAKIVSWWCSFRLVVAVDHRAHVHAVGRPILFVDVVLQCCERREVNREIAVSVCVGGGEVGKVLRCDKVALIVSVGWSVRLCPLVMILSDVSDVNDVNKRERMILLPVCAIEAVEEI